ncbi:unnamed protein product [Vitrella brassicaformis CCMP3155]|uniref:U2A'/phosphoprotein 32 family A C-terminal domain-containing protein n=2 Tax=Vitrella brassicaformis TaxID=1169539 RepID=A0A0G4FR65_VITBC|nr:unnamed protein product [Vitrella brassicaformis CCMP3155]|eukprot:CEM16726.1 unnamed protein product [Vitrella brassicaformis CCMP3155]
MRITIDLIGQADQCVSPVKDRMIALRGFKIPAIENLGATNDHYDCIDLSDNDIIKLGNLPPLKRLRSLLLNNNYISRIADDTMDSLPSLTSLILTNNKLELLCDLQPLTKAKNLERLSLMGNPVTLRPYYRLYVIHHIPSLRYLDFHRIKDKERADAKETFAGEKGAQLKETIAAPRQIVKGGEEQPMAEAVMAVEPTREDIEKIKILIAKSTSIEDVTRLEKLLKEGGPIPQELLDQVELPERSDVPIGQPPAPPNPPPPPTAQENGQSMEQEQQQEQQDDDDDNMVVEENGAG